MVQIASHSSVENDYLKNGFWAMSRAEELPNPGLTATFIDRIIDITQRVKTELQGLEGEEFSEARKALYAAILEEYTSGTDLTGGVVDFDFGNQHFLITKRTFLDVRLVGAPPSAVGKFGGDTDNWVYFVTQVILVFLEFTQMLIIHRRSSAMKIYPTPLSIIFQCQLMA